MAEIEKKSINGKSIYIFEHHHYALLPWAEVKRQHTDEDIVLLSFDHHTDTHDPFLSFAYKEYGGRTDNELLRKLVSGINYFDDVSIEKAIENLRNDEHIKTAIQCGIIGHALIISPSGKETPISYEEKKRIAEFNTPEAMMQQIQGTYRITPKDERTYPESDIYMPDFEIEENESETDVLSDRFLTRHLSELSRISGLITDDGDVKSKYILDIDLDYFHVPEAAEPMEDTIIRKLIRNSEFITIAKESVCVEMCSEGRCKSDDLLEKVIRLIEKAEGLI